MEKDIGKIQKGEYQGTVTEIVVGIREYNGKSGVDIREFTASETYTGPTKKGLRIPADKFEEFRAMIDSIQLSDLGPSQAPAPVAAPVEEKVEVSEEAIASEPTPEVEEDAGIDEDGYM